ncbi:hypothetical protein OB03_08625 [Brevundimonas sp. GN22]
MRRAVMIIAPMAALAACSQPDVPNEAPAPPAEAAIAQTVSVEPTASPTIQRLVPEFKRTEPSNGVIGYGRDGDTVTLTFLVGGNPDGAATAADCILQVRGPQGHDSVVRGIVVPSVTSTGAITKDDIGPDPLQVDVMIGPEGAQVTDHGAASKLCGMGVHVDGFYKRVSTPE